MGHCRYSCMVCGCEDGTGNAMSTHWKDSILVVACRACTRLCCDCCCCCCCMQATLSPHVMSAGHTCNHLGLSSVHMCKAYGHLDVQLVPAHVLGRFMAPCSEPVNYSGAYLPCRRVKCALGSNAASTVTAFVATATGPLVILVVPGLRGYGSIAATCCCPGNV